MNVPVHTDVLAKFLNLGFSRHISCHVCSSSFSDGIIQLGELGLECGSVYPQVFDLGLGHVEGPLRGDEGVERVLSSIHRGLGFYNVFNVL